MATTRKAAGKDYLAIAKKRVTTAKQANSRRRFLIYGRNKKGKSTFGSSAGRAKTLIIDPQRETDALLRRNPYVWHADRWEDMDEIWGALRTGELSPALLGVGPETEPFSWLSVDGLTKINNYALKHIMMLGEQADLNRRPGLVQQKDYNKSNQLMKDFLGRLHNLPMNIVFTAQERMMTGDAGDSDEDEETTFFVADLPPGVRGEINGLVEVIGRIYVVRVEVKVKDEEVLKPQRRLQIGVHERYDTGFRSDYDLPDVLKNPTIPKLVSLMETGKVPTPTKKPGGTA